MTILLLKSTILLLPLLLSGAEGAQSRRGDLSNPDVQNIQLVESERLVGTYANQESFAL